MEMEKNRVCVTGAGGFVVSCLVKLLLSKGYIVHGTVRDPGRGRYSHLNKLDRAPDNIKLFKADLLDYDSLLSAVTGCVGVFHVACPVPTSPPTNPESMLRNECQTGCLCFVPWCCGMEPSWPKDQVKDETCWSDKAYCRHIKRWYSLAKTEAEIAALEYGKQKGLDVVAINPGYVFGPIMQPVLNYSTLLLVKFVQGVLLDAPQGCGDSAPNKIWNLVDVRDVAEATLLIYKNLGAEGRYICSGYDITSEDWVEMLRSLYPDFTYLDKFDACDFDYSVSSEKLQKLGWTYLTLEETLVDSISSYREAALLD